MWPGLCRHTCLLIPAFPTGQTETAVTRGSEKPSTVYTYPRQIDSDRGHGFRNWAKEHDRSGGSQPLEPCGQQEGRTEDWEIKAAD